MDAPQPEKESKEVLIVYIFSCLGILLLVTLILFICCSPSKKKRRLRSTSTTYPTSTVGLSIERLRAIEKYKEMIKEDSGSISSSGSMNSISNTYVIPTSASAHSRLYTIKETEEEKEALNNDLFNNVDILATSPQTYTDDIFSDDYITWTGWLLNLKWIHLPKSINQDIYQRLQNVINGEK